MGDVCFEFEFSDIPDEKMVCLLRKMISEILEENGFGRKEIDLDVPVAPSEWEFRHCYKNEHIIKVLDVCWKEEETDFNLDIVFIGTSENSEINNLTNVIMDKLRYFTKEKGINFSFVVREDE